MDRRGIDWDERFGMFEAAEEVYDPSAGDELVGGLDRTVRTDRNNHVVGAALFAESGDDICDLGGAASD